MQVKIRAIVEPEEALQTDSVESVRQRVLEQLARPALENARATSERLIRATDHLLQVFYAAVQGLPAIPSQSGGGSLGQTRLNLYVPALGAHTCDFTFQIGRASCRERVFKDV